MGIEFLLCADVPQQEHVACLFQRPSYKINKKLTCLFVFVVWENILSMKGSYFNENKAKLSTCKETKICVKKRLTLEVLIHSLQLQNFQNTKTVNGIFNIRSFNIFTLYHWLLQSIVVQVRNFKKQQSKTCLRFSLRYGSFCCCCCCHTHCVKLSNASQPLCVQRDHLLFIAKIN